VKKLLPNKRWSNTGGGEEASIWVPILGDLFGLNILVGGPPCILLLDPTKKNTPTPFGYNLTLHPWFTPILKNKILKKTTLLLAKACATERLPFIFPKPKVLYWNFF